MEPKKWKAVTVSTVSPSVCHDPFEKTVMLGKIEGRRRRGRRRMNGWMASPTQWTWVWVDSERWWWTGRAGALPFMGSQRVRQDWVTELSWWDRMPWSSYFECRVLIQLFHSPLTITERLFSSSFVSHKGGASACLRLLIFLLQTLFPAQRVLWCTLPIS